MEQNQNSASSARRHSQNDGGGNAFLYLIVIFGVSIILSVIILFSANDVFAFVKENRTVTISVSEPTSVSSLSGQLDKDGIVNYGILFKLFVLVTNKNDEVAVGDYELNAAMDYRAIAKNLIHPEKTTTISVTIPEGYTVEQIKSVLIDNGVSREADLEKTLTTYPFKHEFLKDLTPAKNWLEGYLFPDTYTFYKNDDSVQVINKMLLNFGDKYDAAVAEGTEVSDYSMHQITIIASLVEREAQKEDEFAKIAGVIYNRLKNSDYPYLQIDAALQYAVGHKDVLTEADKAINSPYNLYTHKGLPPGPIANPGYTSLYAATHPQSHSYYYYVAMPDGSHLFAKTLTQHNKNIQTAKEAFAAAGE